MFCGLLRNWWDCLGGCCVCLRREMPAGRIWWLWLVCGLAQHCGLVWLSSVGSGLWKCLQLLSQKVWFCSSLLPSRGPSVLFLRTPPEVLLGTGCGHSSRSLPGLLLLSVAVASLLGGSSELFSKVCSLSHAASEVFVLLSISKWFDKYFLKCLETSSPPPEKPHLSQSLHLGPVREGTHLTCVCVMGGAHL